MNKIVRFIIGFLAIIALAATGLRGYQFYQLKREIKKRRPPRTIQYEKPMVVIVPSYNNSPYCKRNLRSIFDQKYSNFRVIYIDDASKDDTCEQVKLFLSAARKDIPVQLIHNETNRGALANLYNAIHSCKGNEIVVTVDGDDHLAHEYVLEKLNRIYSNESVWMTYGNFLNYPTYTQTPVTCKQISLSVILDNKFRHSEWVSSHLRTFYAGLFKKIKLQDFLYEGQFLPMGWDLAFMIPMLEMSGRHAQFVKDTLYLYNRENPISDHIKNLKLQSSCHAFVTKLPKYTPLASLDLHSDNQPSTADFVVFSFDRPLQLYALLESIEKNASHYNAVHVIYRTTSQEYEQGYQKVFQRFPCVHPISESKTAGCDFRALFLQTVFDPTSPSDYVVFAVDDIVLTRPVDLKETVESLKQTKAYGFYLSNGQNLSYCYMKDQKQPLPKHVTLDREVFAWQFEHGEADWRYPNTLDMGLYKKSDIEKDLKKLTFHNPPTLESAWAQKSKRKRVGLFYMSSKSVNIPLNIVSPSVNRHNHSLPPSDLLKLFDQGLKLDILPLQELNNTSRHIEYTPQFISRSPQA